jgi:phosphohistidine phosphatase
MKTLILMRHAKSDWSLSEPDHDRPLNARGIRSARALGEWLRQNGLAPDTALVSDARRTRETFGLLALDTPVHFEPRLYLAEPETMLDLLRRATGDTVLMIGHNPGICALAHALAAEEPAHDRWDDFPTGATLVVRFDIDSWSRTGSRSGAVQGFVVPRSLTEG